MYGLSAKGRQGHIQSSFDPFWRDFASPKAKQEKGPTLFCDGPSHFCPQCGQLKGFHHDAFLAVKTVEERSIPVKCRCFKTLTEVPAEHRKSFPPRKAERKRMRESKYTNYEELPLMLSVTDMAEVLGISRAGAYELVRTDGFRAVKIGTRILIPKDDLISWIKRQTSTEAE